MAWENAVELTGTPVRDCFFWNLETMVPATERSLACATYKKWRKQGRNLIHLTGIVVKFALYLLKVVDLKLNKKITK